jgi:uncharacterized protein
MKLITGIIISILLYGGSAAYADDNFHRAAVEEMLRISKMDQIDQMIKPLFQQVGKLMEQQFNQLNVPEDKRPLLKKYTQRIFDVMEEEMNWGKMKNEYIDLYVKVYTEDEVKDIMAFYRSPAGQKVIDKMPQLIQESMAVSQNRLKKILPKIQQISSEMVDEIKEQKKN